MLVLLDNSHKWPIYRGTSEFHQYRLCRLLLADAANNASCEQVGRLATGPFSRVGFWVNAPEMREERPKKTDIPAENRWGAEKRRRNLIHDPSVQQQQREWYDEAEARRGKKRRKVDVAACFAPLLSWLLAHWQGEHRLALWPWMQAN